MRQSALAAAGYKELRALLPTWLASVFVLLAAWATGNSWLQLLSTFVFVFGSVGLGAQAIGHEYTYRTLGLLLSHPRGRPGAYALKLGVLAILLVSLALIWLQVIEEGRLRFPTANQAVLLVGICSLFLAPALTMLCRNTLGAAVFTAAIPGIIFVGADVLGLLRFGRGRPGHVDAFREAAFAPSIFVLCAIAAVAGWWMFMRLEAIDGRGKDISLPGWMGRRDEAAVPLPARRHPVWALVAKEMHLHHMTFVIAGLFVSGMAIFGALGYYDRQSNSREVVIGLTMLYIGAVPAIIGAMASAEERQLGTAQWQQLMPIASWKQWTVKVGVALALAFVLGAGVPALLSQVWSGSPSTRRATAVLLAIPVILSASLYASSLVNSGIRALVIAGPGIFGAFAFSHWASSWIAFVYYRILGPQHPLMYWFPSEAVRVLFVIAAAAALCATLVIMAGANHRAGDRMPSRVASQLAAVTALVVTIVFGAVVINL